MIYDKIENAHLYARLSPGLTRAFEVLLDESLTHKDDGGYEIDGDRLYGLVQRYTTRLAEKCNLEAHKKYIDVQLIVSGEEIIRHAHSDDLEVRRAHDEATDKVLYEPREKMSSIRLGARMFAIFFPTTLRCPVFRAIAPVMYTRLSSRSVLTNDR